MIRSSYSRAIEEKKLNPAGGPRIEPVAAAGGGGAEHFSYRATFEVYPEIALRDLGELAIDVPSVEVEEPDLDAMIEKLRAPARDVGRGRAGAPREGDRATRRFRRHDRRRAVRGRQGKGIGIVIGCRASLEGLRQGAARSARPAIARSRRCCSRKDYPTQELGRQDGGVRDRRQASRRTRLPELDEQFAASFGVAAASRARCVPRSATTWSASSSRAAEAPRRRRGRSMR